MVSDQMQYTPTNRRKFERNVAHYTDKVTESPETERQLRTMLKNHDMSGVQRERGEPWGHFMARLANEYRRAKRKGPPQKRKKSNNNQAGPSKKTKSSNKKNNTTSLGAFVVKNGWRAAGARNELVKKTTAELKKMVKDAGYKYPAEIEHIHNKSPVAHKLARKYVVWPMVHTIKSKRQQWEPRLLDEAEIKKKNHREMLNYLKVFPKKQPENLRAKLGPENTNARHYATNTLRAILGTEANRQRHIKALRNHHEYEGKKLTLPFDNPIEKPLERLKKMNHATLEAFARKEGYRLDHYNKLNNATKRAALPYVMYDQVHPNTQRRDKLQTASHIRTHLAARNKTMNENTTRRELVEAAKSKKIYNLPKLVKSFGSKGDYIRRLVKASGFYRSIEETGQNPETRKELVRYLRNKIPDIDNVLKNSQLP